MNVVAADRQQPGAVEVQVIDRSERLREPQSAKRHPARLCVHGEGDGEGAVNPPTPLRHGLTARRRTGRDVDGQNRRPNGPCVRQVSPRLGRNPVHGHELSDIPNAGRSERQGELQRLGDRELKLAAPGPGPSLGVHPVGEAIGDIATGDSHMRAGQRDRPSLGQARPRGGSGPAALVGVGEPRLRRAHLHVRARARGQLVDERTVADGHSERWQRVALARGHREVRDTIVQLAVAAVGLSADGAIGEARIVAAHRVSTPGDRGKTLADVDRVG